MRKATIKVQRGNEHRVNATISGMTHREVLALMDALSAYPHPDARGLLKTLQEAALAEGVPPEIAEGVRNRQKKPADGGRVST